MKTFKNLAVLGLYAFALVFGAMSFTDKNKTDLGGYDIGDTVKDVKLKDVNGQMVSFADYDSAKGFIVVFTCNTCPYAVASEDELVAIQNRFKDKGYPLIAINPNNPDVQPDDTYELMQKKAKDAGFNFPYLYDQSSTVYAQFGATKTPHVYILQKENSELVVKYIGAISDNARNPKAATKHFVNDAVNALLNGEEVPLKTTKAIGCSVKV